MESGVPLSDEKLPREEKNTAPENMSNKALLDQLCRNSRLTPLSKPTLTDASSSGDESYRKSSSPLNFSSTGRSHGDLSRPKHQKPIYFAGANNSVHLQEDSKHRTSPHSHRENATDAMVHPVELSNDSTESSTTPDRKRSREEESVEPERKHPRIYLKQDLVKPENLKPEMLVRFRDLLLERCDLTYKVGK